MESHLDQFVAAHFPAARRQGKGFMARCPAHSDGTPSLSIDLGEEGRVLLHCHADCSFEAVLAASNLNKRDLYPQNGHQHREADWKSQRATNQTTWADLDDAAAAIAERASATVGGTWIYTSEHGEPVMASVRLNPKSFRLLSWNGAAWSLGSPPKPRPLFNLAALHKNGDAPVVVVEGEKCADMAIAFGMTATTSSCGAKAAQGSDWSILAGRVVIVMPDNDESGEHYLTTVAAELAKHGATVHVLRLPGLPEKGDIVDWIEAKRAAGEDDEAIRDHLDRLLADAFWSDEPSQLPADQQANASDQTESTDVAVAATDATATAASPLAPEQAEPTARSPANVIAGWRERGPIVHLPTGIAKLDEMTGGGLPFGSRVYVQGSPDAGKTALAVHFADFWARQGVPVFILGIDEEPSDLLMRFLQRQGWPRLDCEQRHPADLDRMAEQVRELAVHFYGAEWTIEAACSNAASIAAGKQAVFIIDSLQTARSVIENDKGSSYESATARVQAIRDMASRHGFLMLVTSEMNRGAYRSTNAVENTNDMAAGKSTGAIEYSARVLLTLRNVPDEADLVELRVTKNKHGPRHRDEEKVGICLRIDRARQSFDSTDFTPAPSDAKSDRMAQQATEDAAVVAVLMAKTPGINTRQLRAEANAKATLGKDRVEVAVAMLNGAVVVQDGSGNAKRHFLDGASVPPEIMLKIPLKDRVKVAASVPPKAESSSVAECGGAWPATPGAPPIESVCGPYVVGPQPHSDGAANIDHCGVNASHASHGHQTYSADDTASQWEALLGS